MKRFVILLVVLASSIIISGKTIQKIRAGAGKTVVQLSHQQFPVDGFVGVHDSLYVRSIVVKDDDRSLAIIIMDQTSIGINMIEDVKRIVQLRSGIKSDDCIVCASHNFSSPSVMSRSERNKAWQPDYEKVVLKSVDRAMQIALSTLKDATIHYAKTTCKVAINRDIKTEKGWWLGYDDNGFTDPELSVISIDNLDGAPIAVLLNLALQSSVLDKSVVSNGQKLISADIAGAATEYVERYLDNNAVCGFLVGCAGDQAPILQANRYITSNTDSIYRKDIHEAGYSIVELLGERIGNSAIRVLKSGERIVNQSIKVERFDVEVSKQAYSDKRKLEGPVNYYEYKKGDIAKIPVVIIKIGNIALVGVRQELNAITGYNLKKRSPYDKTIVVNMVDGADKYIPDSGGYDKFTYEARNSFYMKGSAEIVTDKVIEVLNNIDKP